MSINVINEYMQFSKDNIKLYAQKIIGKKLNEEVFDKFLSVYISLRFYNFSPDFPNMDVNDINECLKLTARKILDSTLLTEEEVNNNYVTFIYSAYLDMINQSNVEVYKQINEFRKLKLDLNSMSFIDDMNTTVSKNISKRLKFFRSFDTNDFELITFITTYPNLYNTELIHHISFPDLYSEFAIERAYEKEAIREQRQFVLYSLLSLKVLKDILNKKYFETYLVDFEPSILDKKNKLKRLLNIIDNDTMKDKINLRVTYSDYLKYKKDLLALNKEGYHFAVIIDDKYEAYAARNEIELNLFSFVIIEDEKYNYTEFKKYKNIIYEY